MKYKPKYQKARNLEISEIFFDEGGSLNLLCSFVIEGYMQLDKTALCMKMWQLKEILTDAGKAGRMIIDEITYEEENRVYNPSIIDVKNLLGKALRLPSLTFTVYEAQSGDPEDDHSGYFFLQQFGKQESNKSGPIRIEYWDTPAMDCIFHLN